MPGLASVLTGRGSRSFDLFTPPRSYAAVQRAGTASIQCPDSSHRGRQSSHEFKCLGHSRSGFLFVLSVLGEFRVSRRPGCQPDASRVPRTTIRSIAGVGRRHLGCSGARHSWTRTRHGHWVVPGILVGTVGKRVHGFLRRLGLTRSHDQRLSRAGYAESGIRE